jgi:hypothetical protein
MVLALAGCSASAQDAPKTSARSPFAVVAADAAGAILYDLRDGTFHGVDRLGRQVWADKTEIGDRTEAHCLGSCPDAVFSASAGEEAPLSVEGGSFSAFPMTAAPVRRVLSARSSTDFLGEAPGAIRIVRPDGKAETIALTSQPVTWIENPAGSTALAIVPGQAQNTVLRFAHDVHGWQQTGPAQPAGTGRGGCVSENGTTSMLLGDEPTLFTTPATSATLTTDIPQAADCALGPDRVALVEHSVDGDGARRTAVRGFTLAGAQAWSREATDEVLVSADPDRSRFALSYPDHVDVVDGAGSTVETRKDTCGAIFTGTGALVTVSTTGIVRWDAP